MRSCNHNPRTMPWPLMLSLAIAIMAAGCQGNRDPVLGANAGTLAPSTTPAPQVTLTVPATSIPGPTTGIPTNTAISATFTEAMAPATLNAATFTLAGPGTTAVLGTVSYASGTAVFTPAAVLTASTTYTATVTTGAEDLNGNELVGNLGTPPAASNYQWTFTTSAGPDTTFPQISSTYPVTTLPGPTLGLPLNSAITATFTKPMNPTTLTATSFLVTGPGTTAVPGSVAYAAGTAVFTPTALLLASTTYTATVNMTATDLVGNELSGNQGTYPAPSNYVWTFTTGTTANTTPPMVTLTVPATTIPGPTLGVATNSAISASFTEAMNPVTLNVTSFLVTGPGTTPVAGTVSYASSTAIFTPSAILTAATTYTATITTAATDVAGNPLAGNQGTLPAASNYVWTFTTSSAVNLTKPSVTVTAPVTTVPGPTTQVPINTAITATFSAAMNPTTLNVASFTVTTPLPGVNPLGVVSYAASSKTAIFTPAAPLAVNTTYTATITTAAQDINGNPLAGNQAALPAASNYVWTFTTAAVVTTPPTITLTVPASAATGVLLNASVNATFSEAMNPATLTTATFMVQPTATPLGAALSGSLTYDAVAFIATFTPAALLIPNTSYTATIAGPTDLTGDLLTAGLVPNPWSFTTGNTGLAPGAVDLGSASSYGIMATAAVTSTGLTVINGDVSLDPGTSLTGFPPGVINGTFHNNDTESAKARIDLLAAYNWAKALPIGTTVTGGADLGAVYPLGCPPGTYTTGSTLLVATTLTLDAKGDANAVWVFQIGSSFTTSANVILANGAQAKNVFWVPTSDGTIGVGTTFFGTIVAGRNVTGVTGATINGRILAGAITGGTIALDTNTVNVPAS